jgi:hypothetical protein
MYGQSASVVNRRAFGTPFSPRTTKALCAPGGAELFTAAHPNRMLVAAIKKRGRHKVISICGVNIAGLIGNAGLKMKQYPNLTSMHYEYINI